MSKGEKERIIKFNSPVILENIWNLCFKTKEELIDFYYKDRKTEKKEKVESVIEIVTQTIYIDKELDDSTMLRALRRKLVNLYLWETGQQDHRFSEEEFCDLASVTVPVIYKTANDLMFKIKKAKKEEI